MTETSNAIYNFKNHIMTNAQKVIIKNLEKAIRDNHEDEEAVDMVKYKEAYGLASKVVSVMQEIYDKLIQETGV